MMGQQPADQHKLYHYGFNLEDRIRADHPLRRVKKLIDFEFVSDHVLDTYGNNGNVSVPPPVIVKLMFLLIYYNVRSERELMGTLPERLDWLWFTGYDLDSKVPGHSVLSKARARWGEEVFAGFFENIVLQCVELGLVDGSKLFVDSSIVDANASKKSIINMSKLKSQLRSDYDQLRQRLEDRGTGSGPRRRGRKANRKLISSTDADATLIRKAGQQHLGYKIHRGVDGASEIITSTVTTQADVNDAHHLSEVIESSQKNTGVKVATVVADRIYGTAANYLDSHDNGRAAHIQPMKDTSSKGKFSRKDFHYNADSDTYTCPAGQELKYGCRKSKRKAHLYKAAASTCDVCKLRAKCTTSKHGRVLSRHERQEDLDKMKHLSTSAASRADLRTRFHLMERSFAQGKRYGFDRCRWRGLTRARIQEYLVCAVQNISVMLHAQSPATPAKSQALMQTLIGQVIAMFRANIAKISEQLRPIAINLSTNR